MLGCRTDGGLKQLSEPSADMLQHQSPNEPTPPHWAALDPILCPGKYRPPAAVPLTLQPACGTASEGQQPFACGTACQASIRSRLLQPFHNALTSKAASPAPADHRLILLPAGHGGKPSPLNPQP